MRPFRPYDPQGPGQKDSGTIVHHRNLSYGLLIRGLSPLVPLELTLNDPIGEVGLAERYGPPANHQSCASESTRSVHLLLGRNPCPKLSRNLLCSGGRSLLVSGMPLPVVH
jgi:hypothetical protein